MSDANQASGGAVVALAGRRIDAPGADPPRFPPERVPAVRQRLLDMLAAERTAVLVCSAACGADLVALEAAARLGLRRRIVLPFAAERFRTTSVTDRPGDWGPLFDRMIAAAGAAGDLVVLDSSEGNDAAYAAANEAIIREAQGLARAAAGGPSSRLHAVIVWEGTAMHDRHWHPPCRSMFTPSARVLARSRTANRCCR
jgi:hypothetical protein